MTKALHLNLLNLLSAVAIIGGQECSVYLAETSLPSAKTQWGIFAGRNYTLGDHIGSSLAIQVLDFHSKFYQQMLGDHSASPRSVGGEYEGHDIGTLLPELAMLMNFHPTLYNVAFGDAKFHPMLNRYLDPGAGGFTAYHDAPLIVRSSIVEGDELFLQVSDDWFSEFDPDPLPIGKDYEFVNSIMSKLYGMYHKSELSEAAMRDVLLRLKNEILNDDKNSVWVDRPHLSELIPTSIEGMEDVHFRGAERTELSERSLDWLRENGKCLDNIRPGNSTIKQAGRGAFATRKLKEGSLIAPAPLLHIVDRGSLFSPRSGSQQELLLNYCFGHEHSNLLLCPTTSVSLINHSSERANAEIRWSKTMSSDGKDWRAASLEELADEFSARLMFDVVATKPIRSGEEIFLDYGPAWEEAWKQHSRDWTPHYTTEQYKYVPSNFLNAEQAPITEAITNDYPNHVYLCRVEPYIRVDPDDVNDEVPVPVQDYYANPSINLDHWDETSRVLFEEDENDWWWPCDVMYVDEERNVYTTRIYEKKVFEDDNGHLNTGGRLIREVTNTPRDAIRFVDRPYHSDQHLKTAFRHEIMIPDDMFPLHWRYDYVNGALLADSWRKENWDEKSAEQKEQQTQKLREAKCGLYYAPSTIPNSGKGLYAGIDIDSQIEVESWVPPIVIPDVDYNVTKDTPRWDGSDYTWEGAAFGVEFEDPYDSQVLAVDMGMMANFHPGLVNAYLGPTYFNPSLDRNVDPGAGASSDYVGHTFISNREIAAGTEVFISYGETWFTFRKQLHGVPLSDNYNEANVISASTISLFTGPKGIQGLDRSGIEAVFAVLKDVIAEPRTATVLSSINTMDDLVHVMMSRGTAEITAPVKSMEWLEEHGECIDHIYVKESTIKQAGNGAFARRFIAKGDKIIVSPMLNTWGRQRLNMNKDRAEHDVNEKQLIYNYHFGHPNSTLLLFPVTRSISINHSSKSPNAKVRWSPTDKKTQYYLQRHVNDLRNEKYATLVMEYVATRDIYPDEEIFIDYGPEWEEAWEDHVRRFEEAANDRAPASNSRSSIYNMLSSSYKKSEGFSSMLIKEMNHDKLNSKYHAWSEDYFHVCKVSEIPDLQSDEWINLYDGEEANDYFGITYDHDGFGLMRTTNMATVWAPCVIFRLDGDTYFDVGIFAVETDNPDNRLIRRVRTVEIEKVEIRPLPAKSDQHWIGAFRHEIKIPDEILPPLWQDLALADKVPRGIPEWLY
mmetsp:Transcript_17467/g.27205  ORF Transcript_17467/g.27205 Transcript_17467/m.27205 type:complete len:1232 (-) Transcript_17467:51-3746(-)|eukprot:CAMPEP_0196809114 /NCGR_PEP_ID=MMETSP1362-20130617/9083_1 /TAXON_ID=163516 /ORGANISM="Leptocylindrus danicus, Strain CCMP1856" /LENGTH=1231 /DNA_ID=CAMNT_0042183695 /DNA_START=41 /DNA_END=3736 /DNA_ORIENTATION=+